MRSQFNCFEVVCLVVVLAVPVVDVVFGVIVVLDINFVV